MECFEDAAALIKMILLEGWREDKTKRRRERRRLMRREGGLAALRAAIR